MSDWTSSFSGFREGMGLLQQGRARRADQKLQERQLGQDDRRLQTYEDESKRRQQLIDQQLEEMRLRLSAPQVPPAPGARPTKFDATGRVAEWAPASEDPKVLDVGGHKVLRVGDKFEVLPPDYSSMVQPPGTGATPAPASPGQAVVQSLMGAPPPAAPAQPASAGGRWVVDSYTPGRPPTFRWVPEVTEPTIVQLDTPGAGPRMFIREVDSNGRVSLNPYNPPAEANKITDSMVTQQNFDSARRYAQQLRDIINTAGTYETRIGDAEAAAGLEQIPYLLAISMAKILDPGSVAREGEVAAAKKYMIPLGLTASSKVAQEAITRLERDLTSRAQGLGLKTDALPPEAPGPYARQTPEFSSETEALKARKLGWVKDGEEVLIGGQRMVWRDDDSAPAMKQRDARGTLR